MWFSKIRSCRTSVEEAEKLTGREDWMTQAVFMNRATSQYTKSSSSVELLSPFVCFLRETPRLLQGIWCNTSSDTLPCTKRVVICRPRHDGKTVEFVHYCADLRSQLRLALEISIKASATNAVHLPA